MGMTVGPGSLVHGDDSRTYACWAAVSSVPVPFPEAAVRVAMASLMFVPAGKVMFSPMFSVLLCSSLLDGVAAVVEVAVTSELPGLTRGHCWKTVIGTETEQRCVLLR